MVSSLFSRITVFLCILAGLLLSLWLSRPEPLTNLHAWPPRMVAGSLVWLGLLVIFFASRASGTVLLSICVSLFASEWALADFADAPLSFVFRPAYQLLVALLVWFIVRLVGQVEAEVRSDQLMPEPEPEPEQNSWHPDLAIART